jgi:hypothetical protein
MNTALGLVLGRCDCLRKTAQKSHCSMRETGVEGSLAADWFKGVVNAANFERDFFVNLRRNPQSQRVEIYICKPRGARFPFYSLLSSSLPRDIAMASPMLGSETCNPQTVARSPNETITKC